MDKFWKLVPSKVDLSGTLLKRRVFLFINMMYINYMVIMYLCIFLLGCAFASFINATMYRIEKGFKFPNILYEPSQCEKCKKKLTFIELLPVVGYLLISGRCSKCNNKINIYYPVSEFLSGLTFLLFYIYQISWIYWLILLFLLMFNYHDITYRSIPKNLTHIFLLLCIIAFPIFNLNNLSLIVSVTITLFLLLLNKLMKKSFGLGDILILLGLGLLLDYQKFMVLFWIGIVIALLSSLIYSLITKRNLRKIKIPMLPFFTISYIIALLYGEKIFDFLTVGYFYYL